MAEKKFLCNCRRCLLKPNCEEEFRKFQIDKYLDSVSCNRKNAGKELVSSKKQQCPGFFFEVVCIDFSIQIEMES